MTMMTLISVTIGCNQGLGDSDDVSSQGATATTAATDVTTGGSSEGSTGGASGTDTEASGCAEPDEAPDDPCAAYSDPRACQAGACVWFEARRFPACDGSCDEAVPFGVCTSWENHPETGCTGPCGKLWRRSPAGMEIIEGEFCFDFPRGFTGCWSNGPPECACGCTPPP